MPNAVNPLNIRTAITQVETALLEVIDLALRYRYPEAADLVALTAREAQKLPDRALIFVATEGVVYRWHTASTLAPAPPYVLAPNVLPARGNGRWIRESSSVTFGPAFFRPLHRVRTGYARAVQIYQGEDDETLARVYGQRPTFLVQFLRNLKEVRSYMHGALYEYDSYFVVLAMCQNLRPGPQALIGSDVAIDQDPGLYQMIGDLEYLLGGSQLGLDPGVKFTDITGEARIVESNYAQRTFKAELDVVVKASVHVVDEDLLRPEVWIERQDAGTAPGQPFDAGNHVARGYRFTPQRGLAAAPAPGVAYVLGQLVSSAPGAHTFVDHTDTYRDLSLDGSLAYSPVEVGAEPPPQQPKTLRIGFTRTNDTDIVADVLLGSFCVPSGADPGDAFRAG